MSKREDWHQCSNCKYLDINGVVLTCHRYPPTVLIEKTSQEYRVNNPYTVEMVTSRFVEVNETDWCGEFEQ